MLMDAEGTLSNLRSHLPQASQRKSPVNLSFGEEKTYQGSIRCSGSDVSCSSTRPFLCLRGTRTTSSPRSDTKRRQPPDAFNHLFFNGELLQQEPSLHSSGKERLAVLHVSGAAEISAPFLPGVIKTLGHICAAAYCKTAPQGKGDF